MLPRPLVYQWLDGEAGIGWIREHRSYLQDNLRNRAGLHGPGLVAGIAAMLGAEQLSEALELHPAEQRQERFLLAAFLAHEANQLTGALHEVVANRLRAAPMDFSRWSLERAGGGWSFRLSLEARETLPRALAASCFRHFPVRGSPMQIVGGLLRGGIGLPIRTLAGMGPGLVTATVADALMSPFLEPGSAARNWIRTGAFFAPDFSRILLGSRVPSFFSTRLGRGLAGLFAAGLAVDLVYHGLMRFCHGAGASFELAIGARAAEMKRQAEGNALGPLSTVLGWIAPEASLRWDSDPRYIAKAKQEYRQQTARLVEESRWALARHRESLTERISLTPLETCIEEFIIYKGAQEPQLQDASAREWTEMLRRQFRGHHLSEAQAIHYLDRIRLKNLQKNLSLAIKMEENLNQRFFATVFHQDGTLKPDGDSRML